MLTILGWNTDDEPALLVSAQSLVAKERALSQIYPEGFALICEAAGKGLIVDFDDVEGTHINTIDLPCRAGD